MRDGDVLLIPKKPSQVMVTGQVYNASAIGYRPNKSAKWYLSQAGGPTQLANKGAAFVIRADGTVISSSSSGLFIGNAMNSVLQPGDMVVVPEKAIGGGPNWQLIMQAASGCSNCGRCHRIFPSVIWQCPMHFNLGLRDIFAAA